MTYLILCPIFHLSEVDITGFTVFTWSTLIVTLRLLRILVQVGTPTYQCCKVFQCGLTTPNSNLIHTLYQAHNIHIYIYMLWVDVYGVLLCVCVCVCKDWVRVLAWPRLIVMLLCVSTSSLFAHSSSIMFKQLRFLSREWLLMFRSVNAAKNQRTNEWRKQQK